MPGPVRFSPTPVGEPAPNLSLTADEGTWIQLRDFSGHLNVLLVFIKGTGDADARHLLTELNAERQRFEQLETAIFAVSSQKQEQLRALRDELGLDFYLLFDPFAVCARSWGACRLRQKIKNTVVIVDKDGTVQLAERGAPKVDRLLDVVARVQGTAVPEKEVEEPTGQPKSFARKPGQDAAAVQDIDSKTAQAMVTDNDEGFLLVDVRTKPEFEADRSPNAVNIPVDEIPHRYHELGQTNNLIFVCQMGGRSAAAAEFMTSIGSYGIYNVIGGMSSWEGDRVEGSAS